MIARLFVLTLILFCFELGLFLVLLPWSSLWDWNYFRFRYPELARWLLYFPVRGVISGLGLLDIALAFSLAARSRELVERWSARPRPARAS
ncbi:MAG: hypothetical protein HYY26_03105 [Acidobacteria bacterium]|nr:hypothetical protein [Acidobacteriota bacterium]